MSLSPPTQKEVAYKKYTNNISKTISNYILKNQSKSFEIEGFIYSNLEKEYIKEGEIHEIHEFPIKTPCFISKRSKNEEYNHEGVGISIENTIKLVENEKVLVKKKNESMFDFRKAIEKRKASIYKVRERWFKKYLFSIKKDFSMKKMKKLCEFEGKIKENIEESKESKEEDKTIEDIISKNIKNSSKDDFIHEEKQENPQKTQKTQLKRNKIIYKKKDHSQLSKLFDNNKKQVIVKDNFISKALENIRKNEKKGKEKHKKTLLNDIYSQYYIYLPINNTLSSIPKYKKYIKKQSSPIKTKSQIEKPLKPSLPGYESSMKKLNQIITDLLYSIFKTLDLNHKGKISFSSLSSNKMAHFKEENKDFLFIIEYLEEIKETRREVSKEDFLEETKKIFQKMSVFDKGKIVREWIKRRI